MHGIEVPRSMICISGILNDLILQPGPALLKIKFSPQVSQASQFFARKGMDNTQGT